MEGERIVDLSVLDEEQFQLRNQWVVVVDEVEIELDVLA